MKIFVFLFLLFSFVNSWGSCTSGSYSVYGCTGTYGYDGNNCSGNIISRCDCQYSAGYTDGTEVVCRGNYCYSGITTQVDSYCYNSSRTLCNVYVRSYASVRLNASLRCSNQCEADSAVSGGIILECQFDVVENKWYKYTCTGGNSCADGVCRRDYYNDESLCLAKYCEENPTLPQCVPPCDSTNWTCNTTTETTQTTVASDNITCIDGTCFGLTYCDYISRSITSCDNECGGHTEQTNEVPMRYEGACNPDNLDDDNMCSATKCIEFTGGYSLYQLCQSREVINGEIQVLPRMVGGGLGSCKNAGYKPSNDSLNNSGSGGSDTTSIPQECYTMGINCPAPDTTKYSDPENRSEENGCSCEPFDGLSSISQIICPDGSSSVIYASCDDWRNRPQSSSSAPESSSSGSENPPASSGAGSDYGNWTTYSQGEDIKGILGVIATNTAKMGNQSVVVTQQQDFLNQFEYQDDGTEPTLNVPDSMLSFDSVSVDTAGILDAIFNRLDSTNRILDTIPAVTGICPCITFFQGSQAQFVGHLRFPEIKIDFADFNGWNLCSIISAIVVALASVVSFFIGFSIFKNISQ